MNDLTPLPSRPRNPPPAASGDLCAKELRASRAIIPEGSGNDGARGACAPRPNEPPASRSPRESSPARQEEKSEGSADPAAPPADSPPASGSNSPAVPSEEPSPSPSGENSPDSAARSHLPRAIDILYAISGAFIVVCYASYLISILTLGDLSTIAVPLTALALVLLPVAFRRALRARFPRAFPVLKRIFCAGMCLYTATFLIFSAAVLAASGGSAREIRPENDGEGAVVLVFGCRAYGDVPGKTLQNRLDTAADLLDEMPRALCVVSGGQGSNETMPEADAMANYLSRSRGIEKERILLEREGRDTAQNLRYSLSLLRESGISPARLFCVSSEFHTPRIALLARLIGICGVETVSAPSDGAFHLFTSLVREYMAMIKMFLFE